MNLSTDELGALRSRYLDLQARRDDLNAQLDQIKQQLRNTLGVGAHPTLGGGTVRVSPNRRFDSDTATLVIPAELLPLVQSLSVDAKRAKQHLPPALYDRCLKESGDPKITVQ